ncbi:MAG: type II toxin-antitoxin system RelB/DinJ family antitoxin [Erysipelotrichaceae bacterium]|nr:type II toxin-antitoxin system RelB/DinJ family antitoxin [Erysipelotrichaceae bacterium]
MATINIRIDDDTKRNAERILKELGISASSAITMFYKQIIRDKALPFKPSLKRELDYNLLNAETKSAIEEGKRLLHDGDIKGYYSASDMFDDILSNED